VKISQLIRQAATDSRERPLSRLIKWPRGGTVSDIIRDSLVDKNEGWNPASDGIYDTKPNPEEVTNPDKEATSGVPENWKDDPRWKGCPNRYKREMNRCPPGYTSNEDGFCLPETNLQRKRRERINRTKPTRLKNQDRG